MLVLAGNMRLEPIWRVVPILLACGGQLSVSTSAAPSRSFADDGIPCPTALRLDVQSRFSRRQVDAFIRELRRIWEPYGVKLDVDGSAREADDGASALRVFVGENVVGAATPGVRWQSNFAGVMFHAGVPGGTIYVSAVAIAALVRVGTLRGKPVAELPRVVQDELIARGIARTVAHELGHVLLASRAHADWGLMRPHYTAAELLADDLALFRLGDAQTAFLRRAERCQSARDAGR